MKYVYLFELDSVKNTDEEIIIGQKALYNEIVHNGNAVVLTYNQLADSRAFLSLLGNNEYFNEFVKLFENGQLYLSQYKDIRTIVQYLINSNEMDDFIYSALPLKLSQKRLIALMKRSLIYSDLSEITRWINERDGGDIKDLFIEVDANKKVIASSLTIDEMKNILFALKNMLSIVLRISSLPNIYLEPRQVSEYSRYDLNFFINKIINFKGVDNPLFKSAIDIISSLPKYNLRSPYINDIYKKSLNADDLDPYRYAENIIDLCLNYAYEISICNVSKHYDVNDLDNNASNNTFQKDFLSRLNNEWNDGVNKEKKYLQKDSNTFIVFNKLDQIPSLVDANRFAGYVKEKKEFTSNKIPSYENTSDNIIPRKAALRNKIIKLLIFSLITMAIAALFEILVSIIQDSINLPINWFLASTIKTILFLTISEIITSGLHKRFEWVISLSDAFKNFIQLIKDLKNINSYKSSYYKALDDSPLHAYETINNNTHINYVIPKELKAYTSFVNKHNDLFKQSDIYPIYKVDLNDEACISKIIRQSEINGNKYGLVYKSNYSIVVVDPISDKNVIYPYERLIPASFSKGVVIIPKINDKFILLNQYRHAIRDYELSFPRGFGESNISSKQNAIKELEDELGIDPSKVVLTHLGIVTGDSGISSGYNDIYLSEIEKVHIERGYEGIINYISLTKDELDSYIKDGKIIDSYTLAAYSLLAAFS